jgi:hypothetical protein
MKKVNFCAAIDSDFDATLKGLKDSLGLSHNADVLRYLVGFYKAPFKSGLDTRQSAELAIKEQLLGNKKISHYSVQIHFENTIGKRVKPQLVNEVLELYKAEIEAHNAKIL